MTADTQIERRKAEERRQKVRRMMFRRPACKAIRWDAIREDLEEIGEDAYEGQWMDGQSWEKLCEALDYDDETLYEFRVAFSDLAAQCEQMREDMDELAERERDVLYGAGDDDDDPPRLFDLFFPAIDTPGEIWGFDPEERDYYGFESVYDEDAARKHARDILTRLTKDQLIRTAGLCLEIARQYLSIVARHDALSSVLAILKGEQEARLKAIQHIEELYERAERETKGFEYTWNNKAISELDQALTGLPDRIWIE